MLNPTQSGLGSEPAPTGTDRTLLIVDDDAVYAERLAGGLSELGYDVRALAGAPDGIGAIRSAPPAFAVIDLHLKGGSGLDLIREAKAARPDCRVVMLTAHGGVASAVSAVKLGAYDYIPKPSGPAEIHDALVAPADGRPRPPERTLSGERARWEHIQRVYELCGRNVSETARRLHMHRRTLQRVISKRAPR